MISNVLETHPDTRFLALSVSDSPEDVIAMIRAGARGYVTKSISPSELADAVKRVADGDAVFSPRLAGFVLDAFGGAISPVSDPELDQLTPREREVLRLIARGLAYKQVARKLSISIKTVETHVSSVLRKLQLSSRHELARWASAASSREGVGQTLCRLVGNLANLVARENPTDSPHRGTEAGADELNWHC